MSDKKRYMLTTRYADSVAKAFRFSVGVNLISRGQMDMVAEVLDKLSDALLDEAVDLDEEGVGGVAVLNERHGMRLADLANALGRVRRVMDDEVGQGEVA